MCQAAKEDRDLIDTQLVLPGGSHRRQFYLQRLGIQKAPSPVPKPFERHAADGELEREATGNTGPEDFRAAYLGKLSYFNVWTPLAQRPPKHQTVCIFDWDDTLFCTSCIGLLSEVLPEAVQQQLTGIAKAGRKLIEMARRVGHTFIITNALPGWVEYTSRKYLPYLSEALQHISIISARSLYEPYFPGEYGQWKVQAFLKVQKQLNSQLITNLISVGDSVFEMDAVHVMGKEFDHAFVKTVKLRERPSAEELRKELELVGSKFQQIVLKAKDLRITLERMPPGSEKAAPSIA